MDKKVTIELSETDAKLFVEFQKNYDVFSALVEGKVFDLKNGSAEVHFDKRGILMGIDLHINSFRRIVQSVTVVREKLHEKQ